MKNSRYKGFTLLELLIAMAILAVAMGALLQASAQHTVNTVSLRDRAISQWVAANKLTELQLQKELEPVGKREGDVQMANSTWYWRTKVEKVSDKNLRRVEVSVRKKAGSDGSLYTLPGFLASSDVYGGSKQAESQ